MGNLITKTQEEEIIIKCSLENMIKAFFKDYMILWHDPNVDSQENQQYIAQLKKFCEVVTVTEWQKARDYLQATQAACHVVTSGTNGELLVKEISLFQSVVNIYVFCGNKEYHSNWAKNYASKVSCVETQMEQVLSQIQQNLLDWYKKASSLKLTLPAFAPVFNDSDKSQMNHLHRFLKVIPNFQNRLQAKNDFIQLSKAIYSDPHNQKLIQKFEKYYNEYNKDQVLRWYTQESFLYKVTNNCLRIATPDSIQYCRLLLKDIEQAIKEQYKTKSKSFNGLLHRGAYLSQEEWSNLKENFNKEVEMHGFLSVSKEKGVALKFMETDSNKKVLITIIVPKGSNEEEQGFAEIHEFSAFPEEKEILFNVRSRFTVLETEDQYSQDLPYRHLVLLYGAQGFRRFLTEQRPTLEVPIHNIENFSCNNCNEKLDKICLISINDSQKQNLYCNNCINSDLAPFLYLPIPKYFSTIKINGCLLLNSSPKETPFYGYKCCKCQEQMQKVSYLCTDCNEKWCQHCFKESHTCIEVGHRFILEMTPFSFWCEKMSEKELSHSKFQDASVGSNNNIFQQAKMYFESHLYEKALEYYTIFLQQNEEKGQVHDLAVAYFNIGSIYKDQQEYKKALKYYIKFLDIVKPVTADFIPEIANSFNHLGVIYEYLGEFQKALEQYFKFLDIIKSVHGDSHPDIASAYNNIGTVYANQGEYQKALEYHLKSLDTRRPVCGDHHPDIAISYHNIAFAYKNLGNSENAIEYYLKSLEITKSVHGDKHPNVASSYNNLGTVYLDQGDCAKALEYYLESLEIRKLIYGDNHPEIANCYNNIGNVYKNQRDERKALEFYFKSLNIQKSINGNPQSIADCCHNIGLAYSILGEFEAAIEYLSKSFEITRSIFGDNHPNTIEIQQILLLVKLVEQKKKQQ